MSTPEIQTRTQFTRESILEDYRVAVRSRQASLIGRKEVLTGKAKFGIFGDGKEVAQLAYLPGNYPLAQLEPGLERVLAEPDHE